MYKCSNIQFRKIHVKKCVYAAMSSLDRYNMYVAMFRLDRYNMYVAMSSLNRYNMSVL
jgi:hypothetical protein